MKVICSLIGVCAFLMDLIRGVCLCLEDDSRHSNAHPLISSARGSAWRFMSLYLKVYTPAVYSIDYSLYLLQFNMAST